MTCEVKLAAPLAGSSLEFEATYPRLRSLTATFLTLNPTLSPGRASRRASWCISTDLTSVVRPVGPKVTTIPGLMVPVSTRPTGTVPIPPILNHVKSVKESRSLVPVKVGGPLNHVVSLKTRDWDESNFVRVVPNLLQGESKQSMLTGLTILGDTSFKTTSGGVDDEDSTVSLDHVLDEITMTRGINDSTVVLGSLKLPQSNINGDTTFTLSLELVKHPGILERPFVHFSSLLLEPFNDTLVNPTKLVDQVSSGG
ncbi:hypothetical protein RJ639_038684 [Escallonia herrerae]|uniref:Uncharacterized protein n=1 Tax=Escallonia herrerae TaxID=1293975 RepID=A0AA88WVR9_9ASTE|nr:hypothetical protein RJ639_038684 [Escallonia herrerae]